MNDYVEEKTSEEEVLVKERERQMSWYLDDEHDDGDMEYVRVLKNFI